MPTNGLPDFSNLSNDPFTAKQIRLFNYLNIMLLGLGVCCMGYWYYLTQGKLFRKIDIAGKPYIEELWVPIGTISFLVQGIFGLISFKVISQMTMRKLWFIIWLSMLLSGVIIFSIIIQKVD